MGVGFQSPGPTGAVGNKRNDRHPPGKGSTLLIEFRVMISGAAPFRSVVFFRSRPPITRRTERSRTGRKHNTLDTCNTRGFHDPRRTNDVHPMHRIPVARRK